MAWHGGAAAKKKNETTATEKELRQATGRQTVGMGETGRDSSSRAAGSSRHALSSVWKLGLSHASHREQFGTVQKTL